MAPRTEFLSAVLILIGCLYFTRIGAQELTRRQIESYLLDSSRYDPNIVPDFDEEYPTNVSIQITIHDMHSISEATMEYSVDIYLRMWWRDERLDFSDKSNYTKLELDTKNIDNVWQPDIFFANEKRASVHTVTTTNKLMHILTNGTIIYSIRLAMTLTCSMLLQFYPFDGQSCPLIIESFGYTNDNINLKWHQTHPVVIEDLIMPQFELVEDAVKTSNFISEYSETGKFSTLKAELHLKRKIGFYVLQVFVPAILLVILSWVSFWVDPNAVPARVSLGVTCVLTMTTESSGFRQSLPPVSYVKAIDVWMFVCLLFVFAALVEFAIVNVLLQRGKSERSDTYELDDQGDSYNMKDYQKKTPKNGALDAITKAKLVDRISKFLFPILYSLFLIIFFTVYVKLSQQEI